MGLGNEMIQLRWREWWWVLVFCLTACCIYTYFMKQKSLEQQVLAQQLDVMEQEKILALQEKEFLHLQIASQKDPSWIEMILMRDLGVVPEGWLKVHFISK